MVKIQLKDKIISFSSKSKNNMKNSRKIVQFLFKLFNPKNHLLHSKTMLIML